MIAQTGLGTPFHEYLASAGSDQRQVTALRSADAAACLENWGSPTGGTQILDLISIQTNVCFRPKAVLGCQLDQFGGCYAQRVCHSVEEVDLQHADLGVAFDDIRQCLYDRDFVLGFELTLHAAYNDLRDSYRTKDRMNSLMFLWQ